MTIYNREVICYQLEFGKKNADLSTECSSCHQVENLIGVKTTLLFIAIHYQGYTSLVVKGRLGLLLPPCLLITAVQQPGTSSPPSRLKRSSTVVIWMCKASFTNNTCPLPWSSTVVSYQWIGWWYSLLPKPMVGRERESLGHTAHAFNLPKIWGLWDIFWFFRVMWRQSFDSIMYTYQDITIACNES